MTMVPDLDEPVACSAQLEGGAMTFVSPELLAPQRFGKEDSTPTPQADIYAFGLVIFQVCEHDRGYRLFLSMLSPGPYGRDPIPWCSTIGVGILCDS